MEKEFDINEYFKKYRDIDKELRNKIQDILNEKGLNSLLFEENPLTKIVYYDSYDNLKISGIKRICNIGNKLTFFNEEEYEEDIKCLHLGSVLTVYTMVLNEIERMEKEITIQSEIENKSVIKYFCFLPLKYCSNGMDDLKFYELSKKHGKVMTMEDYLFNFRINNLSDIQPNKGELRIIEKKEYVKIACPNCGHFVNIKSSSDKEICPICRHYICEI